MVSSPRNRQIALKVVGEAHHAWTGRVPDPDPAGDRAAPAASRTASVLADTMPANAYYAELTAQRR
jgi:hypothetical protein